jgi:hypothetical protein
LLLLNLPTDHRLGVAGFALTAYLVTWIGDYAGLYRKPPASVTTPREN